MAQDMQAFANIPVIKPGDHQAGIAGDSINMGRLRRVVFHIMFGSLTGDAVLTITSGATAGTATTAETFGYMLGAQAQGTDGADTFGTRATSSSLTLTAASYQNRLLVCEIDASSLTTGQPWVTLAFSAAADALNAAVTAYGFPRYASAAGLGAL